MISLDRGSFTRIPLLKVTQQNNSYKYEVPGTSFTYHQIIIK